MRDGKTFHMDVDNLPSQKLIIPRKLNLMNTVFVGGYSDSLLVFESSVSIMEVEEHEKLATNALIVNILKKFIFFS